LSSHTNKTLVYHREQCSFISLNSLTFQTLKQHEIGKYAYILHCDNDILLFLWYRMKYGHLGSKNESVLLGKQLMLCIYRRYIYEY